ncbi:hypothetical protein ABZU86_09780 [Streptomyces sp. NPDC005271]|uniref:hypothetical protein n=1 Tax=unclassified Streptomyces TaxID=2593676 RepID=UPI00339F8B67
MDIAISTSLIAAGSAIGGVVVKMAYDGIIERGRANKENQQRFIQERKEAYDDFLRFNKEHVQYREALREVALIARAGLQVKPEVTRDFPSSRMRDLVDTLDRIRRLAHMHEVVQVAERVVSLHGDAAAALRFYVQSESLTYGLPLFLADRLGEDQILEFVSACRRDLLLGPPKGAPKNFPMIDRGMPVSRVEAEQILRHHLQSSPDSRGFDPSSTHGTVRPLVEEDRRDLETPKFRALIADPDS